jgi:hypothetical protein
MLSRMVSSRLFGRSAALALAALLASCAGTAVSSLAEVKEPANLTLKTAYHYEEYYRFSRTWLRYSVGAGPYQAFAQNDEGTFFVGTARCLRIYASEEGASRDFPSTRQVGRALDCGIFVPFAAQKPALLFTFIGGDAAPGVKAPTEIPTPTPEQVGIQQPHSLGAAAAQGAGIAIGLSLAQSFAEAERGRIKILSDQPTDGRLRALILGR